MNFSIHVPTLKRPTLPKLPAVSKKTGELAAQAVGVLSVLIGVSAYSVPCSFILGGLTLIFAIERQ